MSSPITGINAGMIDVTPVAFKIVLIETYPVKNIAFK